MPAVDDGLFNSENKDKEHKWARILRERTRVMVRENPNLDKGNYVKDHKSGNWVEDKKQE